MEGFRTSGIGPAKRRARSTGGYVDPSTVTGRPWPGYRSSDFGAPRKRRAGRVTVKQDPRRTTDAWAALRRAWTEAPLGDEKRAALAQLSTFEKRHGLSSSRRRIEVEIVTSAGAVASAMGEAD